MILATCHSAAHCDVTYKPGSGNRPGQITLSGEILTNDIEHFSSFAEMAHKDGPYVVLLDSSGGDLETALAMGRIIRKHRAIVIVEEVGKCLSSCVFVLAGGITRAVYGPVGIHRPFDPKDLQTNEKLQRERYEQLGSEVKSYLETMNIPAELYDHMIRIPPQKITYLSRDQLQRYGLSENDPYADAAMNASSAKRLGISTEEFIRRMAKVNTVCGSDDSECVNRVLREGE